jgi:hypothetical protein
MTHDTRPLSLRNNRAHATVWYEVHDDRIETYVEQASGATFHRETSPASMLQNLRGDISLVAPDDIPREIATANQGGASA